MRELSEVLRLLLPVIAIQVAMQAYGLYLIAREGRWSAASKLKWAVVVLVFGVLGVLAYLFIGRRR